MYVQINVERPGAWWYTRRPMLEGKVLFVICVVMQLLMNISWKCTAGDTISAVTNVARPFGTNASWPGTWLFTQREVSSVASAGRSIPVGVNYCCIRGRAIWCRRTSRQVTRVWHVVNCLNTALLCFCTNAHTQKTSCLRAISVAPLFVTSRVSMHTRSAFIQSLYKNSLTKIWMLRI
jgi:hypothetical protein